MWRLLPEQIDPDVAIPPWPAFLRGCVAYRQSLDEQLPDTPEHTAEYPGPSTLSIGSIVLNVADVGRAREFWTNALGYRALANNPDFLAPKGGNGVRLHLDSDDRTHLDLWCSREGRDVQTEVERLVSLGARRVDGNYPEEADFVVLADPEGTVFCVIV